VCEGSAGIPLPELSSSRKCSKQELRRLGRNDDVGHRALASIRPDGGLRDSSLLHDQQAFRLPAQGESPLFVASPMERVDRCEPTLAVLTEFATQIKDSRNGQRCYDELTLSIDWSAVA
jgi:hypothetical protein